MSRYSVYPEEGIGPGGEIVFRKHPNVVKNWYDLYVGDVHLGVAILFMRYWTGISYNSKPSEFFNVHSMQGFASRSFAGDFIIRHHGYWMRQEREMRSYDE